MIADTADFLIQLHRRGVRLWADRGQLRYRAPGGGLTAHELDKLRTLRAEITLLLQQSTRSDTPEPQILPRLPSDVVPLTYSQQLWWNCLELGKHGSQRGVAAAVRLAGPVNVDHLKQSLAELVRRHESLRTRIIVVDGVPMQHVDEPDESVLNVMDLTGLPENQRAAKTRQLIEELVSESFPVATGPLFVARLLKLNACDHVLIIATDHIISDAASIGIAWREIFALYTRSAQALPCSLPKRPVQFADYAVWQHRTEKLWMEKHGEYWSERLSGAPGIRLCTSGSSIMSSHTWASLSTGCCVTTSARLRELSREAHTTLVMSALTAYVAFLFRWCEVDDLVVAFVSVGRVQPELQDTIGYFGGQMFLRMRLRPEDTFLDLLGRVTEEYGLAYEHSDCGRIATQIPRPLFIWNPRFNWIPRDFNMFPEGGLANADGQLPVRVEPCEFQVLPRDDVSWDGEIELQLSDSKEGVGGIFMYRADRFAADEVERFERNWRLFVETLANEPHARVSAVRPHRP